MLNVYEQVSRNKFRSNLILFGFVAFVTLVFYFIAYTFELDYSYITIAFTFSLLSSVATYFWGDKMIVALNHARPANRQEYFDFYTVAENLSISSGIPKPALYVIDDPAPNAFATGRDPEHALVAATTGLLSKLNRTELEGVVAHEISHIKNFDIRLMMFVSILIGSISILINMANRSLYFRKDDDRENRSGILAIIGLFLIIFAPLIAQLIQLAISRRREYLADASAVKLTRQPNGLIQALQKISSDPTPSHTASTSSASLYISNPFKGNKIASLFSTHPPVEERIKALQQMM